MNGVLATLMLALAMGVGGVDAPATNVPAKASLDAVLCSIDVVNEEPAKILQALGLQTKANLILLSAPDRRMTIRLADVPLRDMIRHICALAGLSHIKIGETYVLAPPAELKAAYPKEWEEAYGEPVAAPAAPATTEFVRVSYVSTVALGETLRRMFTEDRLQVFEGPRQMPMSMAAQDASGSIGSSAGVLTGTTRAHEEGSLIVLRGDAESVQAALGIIRQLDTPRRQVAILVTVHDVAEEAFRELGLQWTFGNIEITETPSGFNFGRFTRSPMGFAAAVRALERQDRAKLLASPNVSVLDGERAFILVGDRINFPVLVGFTAANTPIFDRQQERVGIYLQVTSSIGQDDQITLSLAPQVSTITGFLEVNGASYPHISTREAQTTLRVGNGETVVIGGLIKSEEIAQIERVPILSQIPVFGELFRRRKRIHTSSQLIISLTPVIMESPAR